MPMLPRGSGLDFEAYENDWLMLASSGRAEDYAVAGKYAYMVQQNWEAGQLPPPATFEYTLNPDNNRVYGKRGHAGDSGHHDHNQSFDERPPAAPPAVAEVAAGEGKPLR